MSALTKDLKGLLRHFLDTIHFSLHGKREPGSVLEQMYSIGNRSAFFLTFTMGFIGMIMVFQSGMQAAKVVPEYSLLGAFYIKLLIRDFAASIGAIPLATRVGAGIAAELATMTVTEQVDALRMSAAEPVDYLVVPRFLASILMTTALLVLAGFVALLSGMFTARFVFEVNAHTFLNFGMVTMGDFITGVAKCVAYGAAIPIVSSYRGLGAYGGAEGVGRATTDAVVHSTLAIILLNFILSSIGFLIFPA